MENVKWVVGACVVIALAGCRHAALQFEGENGAFSPDGKTIAFQRHNGHDYDLGLYDRASGQVSWIDAGKAETAYPTWRADGALAFTQCMITQTAYVAKGNPKSDGFNFHLRTPDGRTTQITHGRNLNSTCCFAPDGTFYFVSPKGLSGEGVNGLWVTKNLDEKSAKMIYTPGSEHTRGVQSPTVSPNGKLIAWAEFRAFMDAWTVVVARRDKSLLEPVSVLPFKMTAYSPAWHPDGIHLFVTGYRLGDPGWSIYVVNVMTGAVKRLCEGRNPSVSPDGASILYDDGHVITCRAFTSEDVPQCAQEILDPSQHAEKVLLRLENPARQTRGDMPKEAAFGSDDVWFARAVVDWDGDSSKYQRVFWGGWTESYLGCQLYFAKGTPHFATRTLSDELFSVSSGKIYPHDKPITITGIRTRDAIYVSVNDAPPVVRQAMMGLMNCDRPTKYTAAVDTNPASRVRWVEFGRGWPKNVPAPVGRKELAK